MTQCWIIFTLKQIKNIYTRATICALFTNITSLAFVVTWQTITILITPIWALQPKSINIIPIVNQHFVQQIILFQFSYKFINEDLKLLIQFEICDWKYFFFSFQYVEHCRFATSSIGYATQTHPNWWEKRMNVHWFRIPVWRSVAII